MSAIAWAQRVRCDWPGCQSEGEATLGESLPYRQLPAGWADLSGFHLQFSDGRILQELCSIHALATFAQAAKVFQNANDQ